MPNTFNTLSNHALERLGKEPDTDISRAYNVSVSTVRSWRVHLEIPAYDTSTSKFDTLTSKQIELLGSATDVSVAKKLGVSGNTIKKWRDILGVGRYKKNQPTVTEAARTSWGFFFDMLEKLHARRIAKFKCPSCDGSDYVIHVSDDSYAECSSCEHMWVN